ncbi:hypothetical protein JCM11251_003809 [Rhodosporidiobolus azoricus]
MLRRSFSLFPILALTFLLLLDNALPSSAQNTHHHHQSRALSHSNPAGQRQHFTRSPFYGFASENDGLQKRQDEAPGAAVQVGQANPEANDGDKNNFRVELPSRGSADGSSCLFLSGALARFVFSQPGLMEEVECTGGISAFNKRQAGVQAKEEIGDSNPAPAKGDLNNRDDNTPVKSDAGAPAGMTDFRARTVKRSPAPVPFARPVPRPEQLNMFPHHLAARGKADGTIEIF